MWAFRRPPGFEQRVVLKPYSAPLSLFQKILIVVSVASLAVMCLVYGFFYALTTPYLITTFAAPLGALALVAIWALPDLKRSPVRTMERLFFAFFVCLVLWPGYLALAFPGLPWITLLRLTGIPMALVLLVAVSTSKAFRHEMAEILGVAPAAWKMLAAFVLIQVLTVALSAHPAQSIQKVIIFQTNWTAIFFVSCYVFAQPGRAERFIFMLWLMAVAVCLFAMWEVREQKVLWQDHVPSFLKIEDAERLLSGVTRANTGKYRAKAMFTTPLGLAEFLALSTPFILHFIAGQYKFAIRILAFLSLLLILHVVLSTDARLGMVGMMVAVLLYVVFWGALRWRRSRTDMIGPLVVLAYPAFFMMLVGLTFVSRRVQIMVWGSEAQATSNDARHEQIALGLPKILLNPIGHGAGQAADTIGWRSGGFLSIDNYYLLVGLEYGVVGFILYYGLLLLMASIAGRSVLARNRILTREQEYLIPISVSLVVFFVIKSVFSEQDNHPIIYMLMGMVMALVYRSNKGLAEGATDDLTLRGIKGSEC